LAKVKVISDYIISPLGMGSQKNYKAVKRRSTKLHPHFEDIAGLREPAEISMLDRNLVCEAASKEGIVGDFTFFELTVILCIKKALENSGVDPKSDRTGIVLSTTKGNIELLDRRNYLGEDAEQRSLPGTSAKKIAQFFCNPNEPVVVSNACISGVCAEILASRQILDSTFDNVIVAGCDLQELFTVTGFQSFKALSRKRCRPFDKTREGLNLGEAAAVMILSNEGGSWSICSGAIRNDANHISGPSRTGEGSHQAIMAATTGIDKDTLAFINVHGTSTAYNDEMESIAIGRSELDTVPVNALKGNFGHTMGAAGILESIISMRAVEDGTVLGTKGFNEIGVSVPLSISKENRETSKKSFVKLLSGFGGCNAAALFTLEDREYNCENVSDYTVEHSVTITPKSIVLDGEALSTEGEGKAMLDAAFKSYIGAYPKYFKMDVLCRLGFVASELLLKGESDRFTPRSDRAVVLFNRTSSLCNDRNYQATIQDPENFYPSPSLFVYTLANIVTGEIAIRNKYHGETSFYVLDRKDDEIINRTIRESFMDLSTTSALTGWVDCTSEDDFFCEMHLVSKAK